MIKKSVLFGLSSISIKTRIETTVAILMQIKQFMFKFYIH